ncbi:hypothetical protein GUJ93_ZPchr0006g41053 [Zizania palustris]|uniref:Uncharacterized protein n=1 Tax=Zizania palustris TaxID=103762 RepID=A0A8J5VUQ2_ZIZPA|nr:hypothetical protein GUJ93_ZPchr0006g41053 [Zizania palustris]
MTETKNSKNYDLRTGGNDLNGGASLTARLRHLLDYFTDALASSHTTKAKTIFQHSNKTPYAVRNDASNPSRCVESMLGHMFIKRRLQGFIGYQKIASIE